MKHFSMILILAFCAMLYGRENLHERPQLEDKIDRLASQYTELDIFSGVVLVAQEGKPVYHKAFGLANREKNIPNTLRTRFDIGSMNKTFTKVVILQLADEGKLDLSDKLVDYLPGFTQKGTEKITIEHLLTHQSGFGDYHSPEYMQTPPAERTINWIVERVQNMPLMFEPGTEQEYSNAGFVLLGAIIEKVTGTSYHRNVVERIIEPLGLQQTHVENKSTVPQKAIGYFKTATGELRDNNNFSELPNPDGGFHSTTSDIMTFYREYFYGNTLLDNETRKLDPMFGFVQEHRNSGGAIPLAGGFPGANTVLYEILRDRITVVVFANMDEPVAEQLGAGILAIIRGQQPREPQLPAIQNVYNAYKTHGTTYVKENWDKLIINFHPGDPHDMILNQVGYELLFSGKTDQAIEIFTLNTEMFPEVANVWDSLGEAWRKKGDNAKALKFYKRALSIRPDMPSAKQAVEELEGNSE